jgi:7,8-dihydropterin-6-yl-methyl-4-(beta-D-ribofuranosyl)aminobenzene 5'-phosphate synthase
VARYLASVVNIGDVGMRLMTLLAVIISGFAHAGDSPTSQVEVLNLYDNFESQEHGATLDWGFSTLVRYRDMTILFDGGSSAALLERNAQALGVDLRDVDIAVLSHNHYDHISGFDHLLAVNPDVKIFLPNDRLIGGRPSRDAEEAEWNTSHQRGYRFPDADVRYVKNHQEIAPGISVIVTNSELVGYFNKYPPYDQEPLLLGLPELTLAVEGDTGWVLVTGCSHSGVGRIVQAAKSELGGEIQGLVGGFHLLPYSEEEVSLVVGQLLDNLAVNSVAPAHCTGETAHGLLEKAFGQKYTEFGLGARASF